MSSDIIQQLGRTLGEWLALGGPVMVVLAAFSLIGLAIILIKSWQLLPLRRGRESFIEEALAYWSQHRPERALRALDGHRHPVADVMRVAMEQRLRRGTVDEAAREETLRVASGCLRGLSAHLRGLEVISNLAPLLGLLGTVFGMIGAFQQLQSAGANVNPGLLAGGIWEALITTAAGLVVAIPAAIALNLFEGVVDRLRHSMEDAATQVFTLAESTPVPVASRPEKPEQHARTATGHAS